MRVYIPSTMSLLNADKASETAPAFAVTPALRRALPDEDDEGLEFSALLSAADESLELIGLTHEARLRRIVIAADVPNESVRPETDPDAHPARVELSKPVPWSSVAAFHVDEAAACGDIAAAITGDEAAAERVFEQDLLWFDASEHDVLAG